MPRKTETNHSPCLISSLWQTALNCKISLFFFFFFVMPEVLIWGGKLSAALVPGLSKHGVWSGRAVIMMARNERWSVGLHKIPCLFIILWKRCQMSLRSYDNLGWKGPQEASSPASCSGKVSSEVQPGCSELYSARSEILQRWRLPSPFGEPAPLLYWPHVEEVSPYVQGEPRFFQFVLHGSRDPELRLAK